MIGHIPLAADDQFEAFFLGRALLKYRYKSRSLQEKVREESSKSIARQVLGIFSS